MRIAHCSISADFQVPDELISLEGQVIDDAFAENDLDGHGYTVAVLDSGVWANHPTFRSGQVSGDTGDEFGHGTPVASLIAGGKWSDSWSKTVRPVGHRYHRGGAPAADIVSIKILEDDGIGNDTQMAQGVNEAIDQGMDVINISAGTVQPCDMFCPLVPALERAKSKGSIVVAAMGNFGERIVPCPARHSTLVIAVGSRDWHMKIPTFSGRERALFGLRSKLIAPDGSIIEPGQPKPPGTKKMFIGDVLAHGGGDAEWLYLASPRGSVLSQKYKQAEGVNPARPVTIKIQGNEKMQHTRGPTGPNAFVTKGTSFSTGIISALVLKKLQEFNGDHKKVWRIMKGKKV